jgi:hypothetical protein
VVTGAGNSAAGSVGISTFYTLDVTTGKMINRGTADRVVSGEDYNRLGYTFLETAGTPENKRSYSSVFNNAMIGTAHARSTLNSVQAWSALSAVANQHMTLDLATTKFVQGVIIQGRHDVDQWVETFKVQYSNDFSTWADVDNGSTFVGASDQNTPVTAMFVTIVYARYIRLKPISWYSHISMRADVIIRVHEGPGKMARVVTWSRALSFAEIELLPTALLPRTCDEGAIYEPNAAKRYSEIGIRQLNGIRFVSDYGEYGNSVCRGVDWTSTTHGNIPVQVCRTICDTLLRCSAYDIDSDGKCSTYTTSLPTPSSDGAAGTCFIKQPATWQIESSMYGTNIVEVTSGLGDFSISKEECIALQQLSLGSIFQDRTIDLDEVPRGCSRHDAATLHFFWNGAMTSERSDLGCDSTYTCLQKPGYVEYLSSIYNEIIVPDKIGTTASGAFLTTDAYMVFNGLHHVDSVEDIKIMGATMGGLSLAGGVEPVTKAVNLHQMSSDKSKWLIYVFNEGGENLVKMLLSNIQTINSGQLEIKAVDAGFYNPTGFAVENIESYWSSRVVWPIATSMTKEGYGAFNIEAHVIKSVGLESEKNRHEKLLITAVFDYDVTTKLTRIQMYRNSIQYGQFYAKISDLTGDPGSWNMVLGSIEDHSTPGPPPGIDGTIHQAFVWSRALSSDEVGKLYAYVRRGDETVRDLHLPQTTNLEFTRSTFSIEDWDVQDFVPNACSGLYCGPSNWIHTFIGGKNAMMQDASIHFTLAVHKDIQITSGILTCQVYTTTGGAFGIIIRYLDDQNYLFYEQSSGGSRELKQKVFGVESLLLSGTPRVYPVNRWVTYKIDFGGDQVKIWEDGELFIDTAGAIPSPGRQIGFFGRYMSGLHIASVRVRGFANERNDEEKDCKTCEYGKYQDESIRAHCKPVPSPVIQSKMFSIVEEGPVIFPAVECFHSWNSQTTPTPHPLDVASMPWSVDFEIVSVVPGNSANPSKLELSRPSDSMTAWASGSGSVSYAHLTVKNDGDVLNADDESLYFTITYKCSFSKNNAPYDINLPLTGERFVQPSLDVTNANGISNPSIEKNIIVHVINVNEPPELLAILTGLLYETPGSIYENSPIGTSVVSLSCQNDPEINICGVGCQEMTYSCAQDSAQTLWGLDQCGDIVRAFKIDHATQSVQIAVPALLNYEHLQKTLGSSILPITVKITDDGHGTCAGVVGGKQASQSVVLEVTIVDVNERPTAIHLVCTETMEHDGDCLSSSFELNAETVEVNDTVGHFEVTDEDADSPFDSFVYVLDDEPSPFFAINGSTLSVVSTAFDSTASRIFVVKFHVINVRARGAYADNVNNPAFSVYKGSGFTVESCHDHCSSYRYFALQNSACWCDSDWAKVTQHGPGTCGPSGGNLCNYIYESWLRYPKTLSASHKISIKFPPCAAKVALSIPPSLNVAEYVLPEYSSLGYKLPIPLDFANDNSIRGDKLRYSMRLSQRLKNKATTWFRRSFGTGRSIYLSEWLKTKPTVVEGLYATAASNVALVGAIIDGGSLSSLVSSEVFCHRLSWSDRDWIIFREDVGAVNTPGSPTPGDKIVQMVRARLNVNTVYLTTSDSNVPTANFAGLFVNLPSLESIATVDIVGADFVGAGVTGNNMKALAHHMSSESSQWILYILDDDLVKMVLLQLAMLSSNEVGAKVLQAGYFTATNYNLVRHIESYWSARISMAVATGTTTAGYGLRSVSATLTRGRHTTISFVESAFYNLKNNDFNAAHIESVYWNEKSNYVGNEANAATSSTSQGLGIHSMRFAETYVRHVNDAVVLGHFARLVSYLTIDEYMAIPELHPMLTSSDIKVSKAIMNGAGVTAEGAMAIPHRVDSPTVNPEWIFYIYESPRLKMVRVEMNIRDADITLKALSAGYYETSLPVFSEIETYWAASTSEVVATNAAGAGYSISEVEVTAFIPLPLNREEYTVSVWIKPSSMSDMGVLGWGAFSGDVQATFNALKLNSSGIVHSWGAGSGYVDLVGMTLNLSHMWQHVVTMFNGTHRTMYLNGDLIAQDMPAANQQHATIVEDAYFGKVGTLSFDGLVDDVAIWDYSLGENELKGMIQYQPCDHPTNPSLCIATCDGSLSTPNHKRWDFDILPWQKKSYSFEIQIQQTQWNSLSKQCVDRIVWPNDISGRNAMKFGPTMLDNIDVHVPLFNSAARGIFKISAWVKVSSDFTALDRFHVLKSTWKSASTTIYSQYLVLTDNACRGEGWTSTYQGIKTVEECQQLCNVDFPLCTAFDMDSASACSLYWTIVPSGEMASGTTCHIKESARVLLFPSSMGMWERLSTTFDTAYDVPTHMIWHGSFPAISSGNLWFADLEITSPEGRNSGHIDFSKNNLVHQLSFPPAFVANVRYVRVEAPVYAVALNIYELNVFDIDGTNVALNKACTSTAAAYTGMECSYAVNGIVGTIDAWDGYHSSESSPGKHWLQVDLGADYNIKMCKLWNRADSCCASRINRGVLQLLDSNSTVLESSMLDSTVEQTFTYAEIYQFSIPVSLRGSYYIKVLATRSSDYDGDAAVIHTHLQQSQGTSHVFNAGLEDLSTATTMRNRGWRINCDNYVPTAAPEARQIACGNSTWFGWSDSGVGSVTTILHGEGQARLDFGNCGQSTVGVYLDGIEISSASAGVSSMVVDFTFTGPTLLEVRGETTSVIKMNAFSNMDTPLDSNTGSLLPLTSEWHPVSCSVTSNDIIPTLLVVGIGYKSPSNSGVVSITMVEIVGPDGQLVLADFKGATHSQYYDQKRSFNPRNVETFLVGPRKGSLVSFDSDNRITLAVTNKNDRPNYIDTTHTLPENTSNALFPILFDDVDGTMHFIGTNRICASEGTLENTGIQSESSCQSTCARQGSCKAVAYHDGHTRFCIAFTSCLSTAYALGFSLYIKLPSMHFVRTDPTRSTPAQWGSHWSIVNSFENTACSSWCIQLRSNTNLDFETASAYTIGLVVHDLDQVETAGAITVILTNVNEMPVVTDSEVRFVFENAVEGTLVGTEIQRVDEDGDSTTCSIVSGNAGNAFKWENGNTLATPVSACQIVVSSTSSLNFEVISRFSLVASIIDDQHLASADVNLVVDVLNVNEAPFFGALDYFVAVNENVEDPQLFAAGSAAIIGDVDDGDSSSMNFFIRNIFPSSMARLFYVNTLSGIISVSGDTNFEGISQFVITVVATDVGGLNTVCNVTVDILDVNEPPLITIDGEYRVLENNRSMMANSLLVNGAYTLHPINVIDPDMVLDKRPTVSAHVHVSSVSPMSGISKFYTSIHTSSDSVFSFNVGLSVQLNHEVTSTYQLQVTVHDGAGLQTTATMIVSVVDANDAPLFVVPPPPVGNSAFAVRCTALLASTEASVCVTARRQAQKGQSVGASIIAQDEDALDTLDFVILSQFRRNEGADNAAWVPINETADSPLPYAINKVGRTAQLVMNATIDHGVLKLGDLGAFEYIVKLRVSDHDLLFDHITVAILLGETNHPPMFLDCDAPRGVLSHDASVDIRRLVSFPVMATDVVQNSISTVQNIRIKISQQSGGTMFLLDPTWPAYSTNCIECDNLDSVCCTSNIVSTATGLDSNTVPVITLNLIVEDDGPGSEFNQCDLSVYVNHINRPPRIDITQSSVSIVEETLLFATFGYITVEDEIGVDAVIDLKCFAFEPELVETSHSLLGIVRSQQSQSFLYVLQVLYPLDFERITAFTVECTAKDRQGASSLPKTFTVSLTRLNEPPVGASPASTIFYVQENSPSGTIIGRIQRGTNFFDFDEFDEHTFSIHSVPSANGPVSAAKCWSMNIGESPSPVIDLTPHAGRIEMTFELKATGAVTMHFAPRKRPKTPVFSLVFGAGMKRNIIELRVESAGSIACCGDDEYSSSGIVSSARLSSIYLKKQNFEALVPLWIEVLVPPQLRASSSSEEVHMGLSEGATPAQNAFDDDFGSYFLSSCKEGLPAWLENDFQSGMPLGGVQIFGNSIHRFPLNWTLQGSHFGGSNPVWENLLNVNAEPHIYEGTVGSTRYELMPNVNFRRYRIHVASVLTSSEQCVQVSSVLFFDPYGNLVKSGRHPGRISVGYGKNLHSQTIMSHELNGISAVNGIYLKSEVGRTAQVLNACSLGAKTFQNNVGLSETELFSVDTKLGILKVSNGVFGGPHGTLNYEDISIYWVVVVVTDGSGASKAYVDVQIHLVDVNEPPQFHHRCSSDVSRIACPHIDENENIDHLFGGIGGHSGSTLPYMHFLRIYSAAEARLFGNGNMAINADPTAKTKHVIEFSSAGVRKASWDIYTPFGFDGYVGFRFHHVNNLNQVSFSLSVFIDNEENFSISFDSSDLDRSSMSTSNRTRLTQGPHTLTLEFTSLGLGPRIDYLELFTGRVERIYSAAEVNILGGNAHIVEDNWFSPTLFHRFDGYKDCYGSEPWYWLSRQTLSNPRTCNDYCLVNEQCNYFTFHSISNLCTLYSSCQASDSMQSNFMGLFRRTEQKMSTDVASSGKVVSLFTVGDFAEWEIGNTFLYFPEKLYVRFRILSSSAVPLHLDVFFNSFLVKSLSTMPFTKSWTLSESININLLEGETNILRLTLVQSDNTIDNNVTIDFLEVFKDERKDQDSYFNGFDIDHGDILKMSLLSGHTTNGKPIFLLSSGPTIQGGQNILYNEGSPTSPGYTFKLKHIYLGLHRGTIWCQQGNLPCLGWSLEALGVVDSPMASVGHAYRLQKPIESNNSMCGVLELGTALGRLPIIRNEARLQAWIKISSEWNAANDILLRITVWTEMGTRVIGPGHFQISAPRTRSVWSLEYIDIYMGGNPLGDVVVSLGNECPESGYALFSDIRIFEKLSLVELYTPRDVQVLNYEALKTYIIVVLLEDRHGLSTSGTIEVHVRNVNERPRFMLPMTFQLAESAILGEAVGTIVSEDPDSVSDGMGTESHRFQLVLESPQYLELRSHVVASAEQNDHPVQSIISSDMSKYWQTSTLPVSVTMAVSDHSLSMKEVHFYWIGSGAPRTINIKVANANGDINWEISATHSCAIDRVDVLPLHNGTVSGTLIYANFSDSCSVDSVELADGAAATSLGTGALVFGTEGLASAIPAGSEITITAAQPASCAIEPKTVTTNAIATIGSLFVTLVTTLTSLSTLSTDRCKISYRNKMIKMSRMRVVGDNVFDLSESSFPGRAVLVTRTRPLQVASPLSFQTHPVYELRVGVYDGPGMFEEAGILVNVLDANESPSVGYDFTYVPKKLDTLRYISENAPIPVAIGNPIPSYDPDPHQTLFFSVESISAKCLVFIGRCTGLLEMGSVLNFENIQHFNVTVKVTDDHTHSLSAKTSVRIRVQNENELPMLQTKEVNMDEAIWNRGVAKFTIIHSNGLYISEKSESYLTIHVVHAMSIPFYSGDWIMIEGTNYVEVDGIPFQVLSYPEPKNFSFSVNATVTNVAQGFYPVPKGFVYPLHGEPKIGADHGNHLLVYDPDNEGLFTSNQTFCFSIVNPADRVLFAIENASSSLYVRSPALNFERTEQYTIQVRVSDDGFVFRWNEDEINPDIAPTRISTQRLSSIGNVQVRVNNKNDFPSCHDMIGPSSFNVKENAEPGTTLGFNGGVYTAFDEDRNGDLHFEILNPKRIKGRLFDSKVARGCNIPNEFIIRDGEFFEVSSSISCLQKCVSRSSCVSWEYTASHCHLYSVAPFCSHEVTSCWMYNRTYNSPLESGLECGYLKHWHTRGNHGCGELTDAYSVNYSIASIDICQSWCARVYPACQAYEFDHYALSCRLFNSPPSFFSKRLVTCGFFREAERYNPGLFQVSAADGIQTVANVSSSFALDFEGASHYSYAIKAVDQGNPPLSCVGEVVVNVIDVNEAVYLNDDVFILSEKLELVKRYEANGLGQMTNGFRINEIPMTSLAWDEDKSSETIYSVSAGPFGISSCETCDNGQLFLKGDFLDYESQQTYKLTVTATNLGNPVAISTATVVINVLDEAEPPKITNGNVNRYVRENSVFGDPVTGPRLLCTDPDNADILTWFVPNNGLVSSTAKNPCGSGFSIACSDWPRHYIAIPSLLSSSTSSDCGVQLVVGAQGTQIDYESLKDFSVLIKVRDSFGLIGEGTVDITVTNVNEQPSFSSETVSTFFLAGSASPGTPVGLPVSLFTSDPEGGSIYFSFHCNPPSLCRTRTSILEGYVDFDPGSIFSLGSVSGQFKVHANPSPIGGTGFQLAVKVTDSEGASCVSNNAECGFPAGLFTIETVLNNTSPMITRNAHVTVQENAGVIKNVTVTHGEDEDKYATVHLREPEEFAQAVGSTVFIFEVPLYHRLYNSSLGKYVNIYGGSDLNSEGNVGKTVRAHPTPTRDSFSYSITHASPGVYFGGVVGSLVIPILYAEDENLLCGDGTGSACNSDCAKLPCLTNPLVPEQRLVFRKVSVNPTWGESIFDIVVTGNIDSSQQKYGILSKGSVDYESHHTIGWDRRFELSVEVKDCQGCESGLSSVGAIVVSVQNVQEAPVLGTSSRSLSESAEPFTAIGQALPSFDPDFPASAVQINHQLERPSVLFSISLDGQLHLTKSQAEVNFEVKFAYILSVIVSDSTLESLFTISPVHVYVDNQNEAPLLMTQESPVKVFENATVGTFVTRVTAFDEDFDSALAFSITSGDYASQFTLKTLSDDPWTAELTISGALDFEVRLAYELQISVVDSEGLQAIGDLRVAVTDVNDISVNAIEIIDHTFGLRSTMETIGGQIVRIKGTNLGVVGNIHSEIIVFLSNAHASSLTSSFSGNLSNCERRDKGIGNLEVDCVASEGNGAAHHWEVHVRRLDHPDLFWKHVVTKNIVSSYTAPSISNVLVDGGLLSTTGFETVILVGTNLGGLTNVRRTVEYGPDGFGLCSPNCTVLVPHLRLACMSAPGHGINHFWTVWLGYGLQSQRSLASTSYHPPSISNISLKSGAAFLQTRGGETVHIHGYNFGTGSLFWQGCFATKFVLAPKINAIYKAVVSSSNTKVIYHATSCQVIQAHKILECSTAAGVGVNLEWFLSADSTESNIFVSRYSYQVPLVQSITGPGATQTATVGGQIVFINGNYFGPMGGHPHITASYGIFPSAWDTTSTSYPPYYATNCSITVPQNQITCLISPGTGKNHSWLLGIGNQHPKSMFFHAATSYSPPIIYDIVSAARVPLSSASTIGGELLVIRGNNFGNRHVLPPVVQYSSQRSENLTFLAEDCNITVPHTEITCRVAAGAGQSYGLALTIDTQKSIVATTSYDIPRITSIEGAATDRLNGDGNETVVINGMNFGPADRPQFFESMTYGETGTEYTAACKHHSHTLITCTTIPGVGLNLLWKIIIFGQENVPSADGMTSYAPPNITHSIPETIPTLGSVRMELFGSNFGVSDEASVPASTWIVIDHGGSTSEIPTDLSVDSAGKSRSYVYSYGVHVVSFISPSLECTNCHPYILVRVKTVSQSGAYQISSHFQINYDPPTINDIYVMNGKSSSSRHLRVVGKNFGGLGTVFLHHDDGSLSPLPQVGVDGSLPSNPSYVLSYFHKEINIEFNGVKGSLSIQRAGVNSSVGTFEQLSPTIVAYDNTLYIKSDMTFDEDELLSYERFAAIPGKCKFVENIDDNECIFFNPVYNQKVSNTQAPYVASHPLVFDSRGYDNITATGHIIFRCKSCGMAFSSSTDTDLRVFVGPIDGYRRECKMVPPAIFEPIEGVLEARCRIPPGENGTDT